jgi:FkbM family methyltransferase
VYERDEYEILSATLCGQDRYLELGAGIGFLTTFACGRVGAENVTAFEANPELVSVARETASRNGFCPEIAHAVLGPDDGEAALVLADDFWNATAHGSWSAQTLSVPMRSFERELGRVAPSYLMVDIEGGETALFPHHPLPKSVRAICIELHPHLTGSAAIRELLIHLLSEGFVLDVSLARHSVLFFTREPYDCSPAKHTLQSPVNSLRVPRSR